MKSRYGAPTHGGAFRHELTHGIGLRGWSMPNVRSASARRRASEMRSHAFTFAYRMPDLPIAMIVHPGTVQHSDLGLMRAGDRWFVAAWNEEVELGCPAWGAKDPA